MSPSRPALAAVPRLPWAPALVAVTTSAALVLFSLTVRSEVDRAEGLYLALVATPILFATLALAPRGLAAATASSLIPVGVLVAALAVPPDPLRGAAVTAILALGLATLVAWRAADAGLTEWVTAALALQLLLESERLLELGLDVDAVVRFVLLPLVAGGLLSWLARRLDGTTALLILVQTLLCRGSFDALSLATLIAFAVVVSLARESGAATTSRGRLRALAIATPLLVADPIVAAIVVTGALAPVLGRAWFGLLLVVAGLATLVREPTPWSLVVERLPAGLLLLLPFVLLTPWRARGVTLAAAIALALVGLRVAEPGVAWLAPALLPAFVAGLAGSGTQTTTSRRRVVVRAVPGVAAVLLAVTLAAAAYPWLRQRPLVELVTEAERLPRPAVALLEWPPVTLVPAQPELAIDLEHLPSGPITVSVDTALANGATLGRGTLVAEARLELSGVEVLRWPLRVGIETAEWAAARSDLRAAKIPTARPWVSWVDASGGFFGQRYRALLHGATAGGPATLRLVRPAELPADCSLTVFHVALRPAP